MINPEAKQFLAKQGVGQKQKVEIQEINGQVANLGLKKGIARIVLTTRDFAKMKNNDILVTHMTTPQFIPILKRAAAIVTDEGGITCHAAIVSRELNVPCIIGTKKATAIIRDGQLIEVNANHGVVRILKRSK